MKIQLLVNVNSEHIMVWTPNLKHKKLERGELCKRLVLDIYFNDGWIFNHCGNFKRISKFFPALENCHED